MYVHLLSEVDRGPGRIFCENLFRLRSYRVDLARGLVWYSLRVRFTIREELADLPRAEQLLSTRDLSDRYLHDRRPERADGLLPHEHSFAIVVESKGIRLQEGRNDLLFLRWPLRYHVRHITMRADRHGTQDQKGPVFLTPPAVHPVSLLHHRIFHG